MSYESLIKYNYKNNKEKTIDEYNKRIKNPATLITNLFINPIKKENKVTDKEYNLFYFNLLEHSILQEQILLNSSKISFLLKDLSKRSFKELALQILSNEIFATNFIEGVKTFKERVYVSLKQNKTTGIVKKYKDIFDGNVEKILFISDFTELYKEMFKDMKNIMEYEIDGKYFRRGNVRVVNSLGKTVHIGVAPDKLVNTLTVENYLESYQNDSFEKKYLTKKISNLEKETHIMRDELRERVKKESFEDVKNDLLAYSFKKANPITKKEVSKILDDEYSKKFQHYTNEEAEAYLLERKDEFSFTITDDGKIKELMNYYYDNMYDKTQLYEDYYNTCKKFLKYGLRMNINDIILNENFEFYDGSTLKEKYGKKETGTVELENKFRKSVFILTLTEYDKESFENEISKGKTPLRISENNAIFNLIFLNKVNEKLENEFNYPKINEIEVKKEINNINFNEYNDFLERDFVRRSILENKNKSNYIEEEPMKNVIVKFGDMEIKI